MPGEDSLTFNSQLSTVLRKLMSNSCDYNEEAYEHTLLFRLPMSLTHPNLDVFPSCRNRKDIIKC